ncbi:MAG TPA: cytochrome c [Anaerolineaceae bacterium]|nr:cytochrome c [Anaerolineaceae bacterium]
MTSFLSYSGSKSHALKAGLVWAILLGGLLLLAGCQQTGNMEVQPYNRPLSQSDFFADGRSARNFVPGTVSQTDQKVDDPALTGLDANGQPRAGFPVPVTNDLVKRGQERFNIYCVPCHGASGHGDGRVVSFKFPKPPDLLGDEVKELPNGKIFDVITNGTGKMFPYGYRVKAPDRWAVIAYIRAMQLKNGPPTRDLTPEELQQLGK